MNRWLRRYTQRLFVLGFWLVVLGVAQWYRVRQGLGAFAVVERLLVFLGSNAYGPLVYIAAYAVRPLFLFSAVLLTLGGGFVFGPVFGLVYTLIGSNLSASVAYVVGRFFGRELITDGEGFIQRWANRLRHNSFATILTLRCLFVPYDLVNYSAGLLHIRWQSFALASLLGSLPGTLAFVLAGASLETWTTGVPSVNPWVLAASGAMFVLNFALSRWLQHKA